MRERIPLFAGLTLLAAAILVGSVAIGSGIRDRNRNDTVTVTGSAKQRITSDYAIWDISVTSQDASAAKAADQLDAWTASVRAFLLSHGIKASELSAQPVSTQTVAPPSNGYTNKIGGYQLTRSFEVRSSRVQAVADVADASSALLKQGIALSAQPLQYVYTKLASIRPSLLAAATKDAQERAKVLVEATGAKLGKLRGVDVGVFQVTSPNSTQVSDYGVYDTSTLQKDVTAVVNVTFALNG
ncbi:MAG TPA: SIMPL domain-containing protein [Gaiellaceae bacterium]|nr:SIMPL domain-containing protein [Gaiellaceae bacterium]